MGEQMNNKYGEELISVVVPVFNAEDYIERCLNSIMFQTFTNLEIILVDDGSNDKSGAICEKYSKKDSRIVVFHQKKGGPVKARKKGISIASGKYIGFVDADDYLESSFFERMYDIIERENVQFVHSGYYKNNTYRGFKESYSVSLNSNNRLEFLCDHVLTHGNEEVMPSMWSKLFQAKLCKSLFPRIPDDIDYGEDLLFLCECILEADSLFILNEAYYYYTEKKESLSNSINEKQLSKEIRLYNEVCLLLNKFKDNINIQKCLNTFLLRHVLIGLEHHPKYMNYAIRYIVPDIEKLKGKRIVIYGAGQVGIDYYRQICQYSNCKLVTWVDKNADSIENEFFDIEKPEIIIDNSFDCVVLAILSEKTRKGIEKNLIESGIEQKKIISVSPITF